MSGHGYQPDPQTASTAIAVARGSVAAVHTTMHEWSTAASILLVALPCLVLPHLSSTLLCLKLRCPVSSYLYRHPRVLFVTSMSLHRLWFEQELVQRSFLSVHILRHFANPRELMTRKQCWRLVPQYGEEKSAFINEVSYRYAYCDQHSCYQP